MTSDILPDWMWHGGALRKAHSAFPNANTPWMDLSTGINPNPWSHSAKVNVDWHRLPEREDLAALEQAAAHHFGVPATHICAVSGSEMAMRLTGLLLGGTGQCERGGYRTHHEMFAQCREVDDLRQAAPNLPLIFANPANPSGRILNGDQITTLLDQRPNQWTLIDEAYADSHPDISVAHHILTHPKLMIFKSLGKFFGLAGLRLGFVIAQPQWLERLRRHIGAWPVSSAAIAIGQAALSDSAWIAETRANISERAIALDKLIHSCGLTSTGHCHLFRRIKTADAPALFHQLCDHGILTRPFADDPHQLRLGLPADAEAFARLEAALRHV